jgi:predicted nuclease of predicted toxin-antitoxin system
LKILLDEDARNPAILNVIRRHNARKPELALDVLRVGDQGAPPHASMDDEIVRWASTRDRIIVSHDANKLVNEFYEFLSNGNVSPGLVVLIAPYDVSRMLQDLLLICFVYEPYERSNQCHYIPIK